MTLKVFKTIRQPTMNIYEAEMKAIECLGNFIKAKKELPSPNSSDPFEKTLGKWVLYQKNLHRHQNACVESPWNSFIESVDFSFYFNDPILVWKFNLETLKCFIQANGHHPSPATQDVDERRLAIWAERNRQHYSNRKELMKNEEICQLWRAFDC